MRAYISVYLCICIYTHTYIFSFLNEKLWFICFVKLFVFKAVPLITSRISYTVEINHKYPTNVFLMILNMAILLFQVYIEYPTKQSTEEKI